MNRLFKNIGIAFVMTLGVGSAAFAQHKKPVNTVKPKAPVQQAVTVQKSTASSGFDYAPQALHDSTVTEAYTVAKPLNPSNELQATDGFTIRYDSRHDQIKEIQLNAERDLPNGYKQQVLLDFNFVDATGPGHKDADMVYSTKKFTIETQKNGDKTGEMEMVIGSDDPTSGSLYEDGRSSRKFYQLNLNGPFSLHVKDWDDREITDKATLEKIQKFFTDYGENLSKDHRVRFGFAAVKDYNNGKEVSSRNLTRWGHINKR